MKRSKIEILRSIVDLLFLLTYRKRSGKNIFFVEILVCVSLFVKIM